MDAKEITKLVEDTVSNTFKQIELSNKLNELEELKATNKALVEKLASVENASVEEAEIPAEKVDEITSIVEKAIGDKVDSLVGEALAQVVERVDKVEEGLEDMEEAMTDKERIKKALSSNKKLAKSNAFKPMSRQSKAYTSLSSAELVISDEDGHILMVDGKLAFPSDSFYEDGKLDKKFAKFEKEEDAKHFLESEEIKKALEDVHVSLEELEVVPVSSFVAMSCSAEDIEKELEAITETLKNAKNKKELEEVKNLLQAFITSSKKIKTSSEDESLKAELEAYHELGTVDEIEAAVEVLETYANEIGSLPELKEEETEEVEVVEGIEASRKKALASRKKALASRKKALASRKKALASRKKALASRKTSIANKLKVRKVTDKKVAMSDRLAKIKELKAKKANLASIKARVKENISPVVSSRQNNTPGSMASALFDLK